MTTLVPADIAGHPPLQVVCPHCGHTDELSLEGIYIAMRDEVCKPGATEASIRRVMSGPTIHTCPSCAELFSWRIKPVRTYAIQTEKMKTRPRKLTLN